MKLVQLKKDWRARKNAGYVFESQVSGKLAGCAVVDYLAAEFNHSSVAVWHERIERGEVSVQGKQTGANDVLRAGDVVAWSRPPWTEPPTPQTFHVLFEDKDCVAVYKPSGLPTLPGGGFLDNTLLNLVRRSFSEATPLHRLGRGTSGIVLFALNSSARRRLSAQWPSMRKSYRALAQGRAGECSFDIATRIGPIDHPRLGSVFGASPQGKPSRSLARVLEVQADTTLFEVSLMTGRPHQIRIHLASIGLPLAGDPIYGNSGVLLEDPGLPGDLGYWLHAHRLSFASCSSGKLIELVCCPPEELLVKCT
jgi:23S rRNA pseudouridine1911/1915/1917 synthase